MKVERPTITATKDSWRVDLPNGVGLYETIWNQAVAAAIAAIEKFPGLSGDEKRIVKNLLLDLRK